MTDHPSPIVRTMIVCEEIILDPNNPKRVSLVNLIGSIRPRRGAAYPLLHPAVCLFVELVECRGPGRLRVDVRDAETDEVVSATPTRSVPLPESPLTVVGMRFRLRKCKFPVPGLYWINLWYNDRLLARRPIILQN